VATKLPEKRSKPPAPVSCPGVVWRHASRPDPLPQRHQYMMVIAAGYHPRPAPVIQCPPHTSSQLRRAGAGAAKWTPTPFSCPAPTAPSQARSTSAGARRPGLTPAAGPPRCSCSVRPPTLSLPDMETDCLLTNRKRRFYFGSMKGWR
jgi:hypothetical protein